MYNNEQMMNITLNLILLFTVLQACIIAALVWLLRHWFNQFRGFLTPEGPDKPSPLATLSAQFADVLARAVVMQAKTYLMGKSSAVARAESAVEGDIAEDTLSMANPLMATLLKSFPKLSRTIRRNPGLAELAIEKLIPMLTKGGNRAPNNGQNDTKIPLR